MGLLNATTGDPQEFIEKHSHALVGDEEVLVVFKTVRDWIAFTNWRVLYVDVQGITGSKKEYLTVPYRSINAFSVESAGTFDLDAEIKIYLSGRGPIEFKIGKNSDVGAMQALLAEKLER